MTNQKNEFIYNMEMMERIFGKLSIQKNFDTERSEVDGTYR